METPDVTCLTQAQFCLVVCSWQQGQAVLHSAVFQQTYNQEGYGSQL
jgi:hypothetical protein